MRVVGVVLDVVLDDVPLDVTVVVVMFGGELDHFAFILGKLRGLQGIVVVLYLVLFWTYVLNGVLNGAKMCKVC